MNSINKEIKRFLLSLTHLERRKKELKEFKEKKEKLKKIDCDELDLLYFNCKAEYEHKKRVLPIFLVSILVSIIMNLWKYFYEFIEKILRYSSMHFESSEIEIVQVVIVIYSILVIFITICIILFIINYTKKIRELYKELLLIEDVRNYKEK